MRGLRVGFARACHRRALQVCYPWENP